MSKAKKEDKDLKKMGRGDRLHGSDRPSCRYAAYKGAAGVL